MGNKWQSAFNKKDLEAGKILFQSGKAKKLTYDEDTDSYSAVVRDDRNYHTSVDFMGGKVYSTECECSDWMEKKACRHVAAMIYLIEQEQGDIDLLGGDWTEEEVEGDTREKEERKEERSKKDISGDESDDDFYKKNPQYHPDLTQGLKNLKLLKQEAEEKPEDETGEEDTFVEEEYRYFYPDDMMKELVYTPKELAAGKMRMRKLRSELKTEIHIDWMDSSLHGTSRISFYPNEEERNRYYYSYSSNVTLSFDAHHILECRCSDWNCNRKPNKSRIGHTLCEHELAAMLLLFDYLKEENPGDKTDRASWNLMKAMGASQHTISDKSEKQEMIPQIHLEPYLSADEAGHLSASFRIGTDKLYKINSLSETIKSIQSGEVQQFGKSTEILMRRDGFQGKDSEWLEYIEGVLEEEQQQINHLEEKSRWEVDYPRIKSKVPIFGKNLDDLFQTAYPGNLEISRKGEKGKTLYRCEEGELHLTLQISPDMEQGVFHGIRVQGERPLVFRGQNRYYFLDEKRFCRMSDNATKDIRILYEYTMGSRFDLRIGRRFMADFFYNTLPKLESFAQVTIDNEDEIRKHIPPKPVFRYYIDYENHFVLCRPEVLYGKKSFLLTYLLDEQSPGKKLQQFRDFDAECAAMDVAMKYVSAYDRQEKFLVKRVEDGELYDLLFRGIPEMMQIGEVHATERFNRLRRGRGVKFQMGVSIDSGLMDLTVSSEDLTQDEVSDILFGYRRKRSYVRLKDGSFLNLENNKTIEELGSMMEMLRISPKEFAKGKMHIPAYRALYLDKMLEEIGDVSANRNRKFRELIKGFKAVEDADFEVPETLDGILRSYQKTGYRWLRTLDQYGFGGILADEMGLGKTLQVIAVLSAVFSAEDMSKQDSLIVCPASLVYNWAEEFGKFAPQIPVTVIAGTQKERRSVIGGEATGGVWITSYDLLKRDIAEYEEKQFRFMVIDEAQYIKNHTTAATKSVKLIRAQTKYALTGTPIENRLSELWSIFDFLMPGFLYDYPAFRDELEQPVVKDADEEASLRLKRMVSPFVLRRLKKDVLKDLPEKLEEVRFAKMDSKQQKLYDAQVIKMKKKIHAQGDEDFRKGKIEILAELTRIRQICCDPSLFLENYDGESAKRQMCMDMMESIADSGHKALVFSQFTTMLEHLEEDLKKSGIAYYKITGSTPKEKRIELVNAFNHDETPVFLISLKAGGTGLNLTGADVVIHYDPWWNVAAENQATDRAHRIGQQNIVTVYKLIVKGTIEEKILKLQEAKAKLADDILSAEGVSSSVLDREELLQLLEE